MRRTQVNVELLPEDTSGVKLLTGLERAFIDICPDCHCTFQPVRDFPLEVSIDSALERIVRGAMSTLECDTTLEWCAHLAPRRFNVKLNSTGDFLSLNVAMLGVANRRGPISVFLHTITDEEIRPEVASYLDVRMSTLSERLLPHEALEDDIEVARRMVAAIGEGYGLAFSGAGLN